jgi:hypothetical protein
MKQIDLHDPSSSHYNVKQMCLKRFIIFMMFEKFEIKKVVTSRNIAKLAIFHEILNLDCQATERNIIM